jgi:hypothetical protein
MDALHALSLLPFVPSGKEYDASRQLFKALGFEEVWEHDGCAGFRNGAAQLTRKTCGSKAGHYFGVREHRPVQR